MSTAVICDKCGKAMYTDSRSDKDAYALIKIEYCRGYSEVHLCKVCYRQLQVEFLRHWTPEQFDYEYGTVQEGSGKNDTRPSY